MNAYLDAFTTQLKIRGLEQRTVEGYRENLSYFLKYYRGRRPCTLSVKDIHHYQLYLKESKKQAHSYINQQTASIKFFCRHVLRKRWDFTLIPYLKENKKLPVVLSKEEIFRILEATENLKHKTILSALYATGIRINELRHLKYQDIDSHQMLIHITKGKGGRERYVTLSPHLLKLLRRYWKKHPQNKSKWLFPGEKPSKNMETDTISTIFRRCRKKARVHKKASCHSLRHSFATHCLEQETDLRLIQKLMGHADISYTTIYLHVATHSIANHQSPFDSFFQK